MGGFGFSNNGRNYKRLTSTDNLYNTGTCKHLNKTQVALGISVLLGIMFAAWAFYEHDHCSQIHEKHEANKMELLLLQKELSDLQTDHNDLISEYNYRQEAIRKAERTNLELKNDLKKLIHENNWLLEDKENLTEQVNTLEAYTQNLTAEIHRIDNGDSVLLQKNIEWSKELKSCESRNIQLQEELAKKSTRHFDYDGYRYELSKTKQDWEQSRNLCRENGGRLAVHGVVDTRTLEAISDALCIGQSWVGLRRKNYGWNWLDEPWPSSNINWADGEPNNVNHNEECAELLFGSNRLNDYRCHSRQTALCEYKL